MLFGVVIGLAGFFQSRDLNKKAIIDGKVFQVREGPFNAEDNRWFDTSAETIQIPEESQFRLLDLFWAFCRNWNRNRS